LEGYACAMVMQMLVFSGQANHNLDVAASIRHAVSSVKNAAQALCRRNGNQPQLKVAMNVNPVTAITMQQSAITVSALLRRKEV